MDDKHRAMIEHQEIPHEQIQRIRDQMDKPLYSFNGGNVTCSLIVDLLAAENIEAYVVGGVPRDLVLGRQVADIDLGVGVSIENLKRLLIEKKIGSESHLKFVNERRGVAVWGNEGNQLLDFSVLADIETDGRDGFGVVPGNVLTDCRRRDFTMNALYFDPKKNVILDPSGRGLRDLKQKKLELVGSLVSLLKNSKTSFRVAKFLTSGYLLGESVDQYLSVYLKRDLDGMPAVNWQNFLSFQVRKKGIREDIFLQTLKDLASNYGCEESFHDLLKRP